MESGWVKIFTTNEYYQAELVKGLLLDNEIESIIVNKQDSAYLFGEIELFVSSDFVLKAKHILSTHQQN
jgi:hypothetical protein